MRPLAVAAAVTAAVAIPGAPPGIGVVAVAMLVAGAAVTAAQRSDDLVLFGAPALALAAVPALLDARWIVGIDLIAAWLLATVAVGGPRVAAVLAPVAALPRIAELMPRSSRRVVRALRGAALAVALAIPFATLFLTADAAFAAVADKVPRPPAESLPSRVAVFAFVLVAALSLAIGATRRAIDSGGPRTWRLSFVEWALPLVVLDGLFLAFVGVQVRVLFGGDDYVQRTAGLTYAEYARQGFWQLLAAGTLTLVVVKAAALVARPSVRVESIVLRLLLGMLCLLTIVVLGSALHRLLLYEDAFGLTRARLAAEAFTLWLAGTFAALLLLGVIRRTGSLPRIVLAWTAFALVAFSLANPDARIAEHNVARWRDTGRIDLNYLSTLSSDATPSLLELPPTLRRRALARVDERLSKDEPLASANLSRSRARRLLRTTAVAVGAIPGLP